MDARNAQHAAAYADVAKDEVVAELRRNGVAAAAWIRSLSEAQRERTGAGAVGVPAFSVAQLIQYGMMGEMERHGGSLREAIGEMEGRIVT